VRVHRYALLRQERQTRMSVPRNNGSNAMFHHITLLLVSLFITQTASGPMLTSAIAQETVSNVETSYDAAKGKTTVKLAPVQISGEREKYISLHMSPAFSFPGHQFATPAIIDFELQTVVRAKLLSTDLYVVFMIDGEKVFLSSNRWAVKRPVPGRVWVGERLVFRMPYETFVKITKAASVEIKFDAVTFSLGETQKQALHDFLSHMTPAK
jgi:hypothetical protein